MSDQHQPPAPPPEPEHTQHLEQQPAPAKERFRDRVWGLRAVIAVALASVILGGLGGAALANVGDRGERDGRFGPGHGRFGGPGGPGGPGMPPGQMRRWDRQHGDQHGPWRGGPGTNDQQLPTPAPASPTPTS